MYIGVYIYIYISEVGGKKSGAAPTGKSYSFRSCVRASGRARRGEAACGREATLLPWLGFRTGNSAPAPAAGVPSPPAENNFLLFGT